MAIHNEHKGFDDSVSVLADDCERCAQHSADPFNALDDGSLLRLIAQIQNGDTARTTADARARGNIRGAFNVSRRLARVMGTVAFETEIGTFLKSEPERPSERAMRLADADRANHDTAVKRDGVHNDPACLICNGDNRRPAVTKPNPAIEYKG